MILHKQHKFFLYFFLTTVFMCSIPEFILLQIKYTFLTGEDNFPFPLFKMIHRTSFIVIFLSLNALLFAGIFFILNFILKRFNVPKFSILFHSMMICIIGTAMILMLQFQLHKFFADAMDAALIKNLIGGNLQDAIGYLSNEIGILFLALFFIILCYCFISTIFLRKIKPTNSDEGIMPLKRNKLIMYIGIIFFVCLPVTLYSLNTIDFLRYNLNRTNAYFVFNSLFDYLSDIDNDGFGSFIYPQDFSILNPQQFPGALDIPNNGIDENGLFGDFTSPASSISVEYKIENSPMHIVIIILESTRFDTLNTKIEGQLVAPNLTKLATEGKSFSEAYSHTGYTGPSLATFFSGHIGKFKREQSLYAILKKLGYQLALFSGQDESWGDLDIKLGTRIYTDKFYDAQTGKNFRVFKSVAPVSIKLDEKTLWKEFKQYSNTLNWDRPQFVYFNMQAAHFPYYHPQMTNKFVEKGIPRELISPENVTWLKNTYWNSIHHADIYIGKIIAELKQQKVWNNTLLLISGDHGEELFDHDHLGHGSFINDVQTHIPLVTNQRNFNLVEPVGQSDIKDNILSYALGQKKIKHSNLPPLNKSVFQLIGNLDKPAKIALRYKNNRQITLDLKNMLVRPFDEENWLPYKTAIKDSQLKSELKKLVNHWESLKWKSHRVNTHD